MKKYLIALIAAFSVAPLTAHADFSGFYGGVDVGYSNLDVDFDVQNAGETGVDGDGIKYGAFLGYRMSLAGLVVGAEGRLMDTTSESDFSDVNFSASSSPSRELGVTGIVGFAPPAGGFMVFGLLGYDNLKTKTVTSLGSQSSTDNGIRYGVGAEFSILPMVSIRGTVSRTDYGDQFDLSDVTRLGTQSDLQQTEVLVGGVLSF